VEQGALVKCPSNMGYPIWNKKYGADSYYSTFSSVHCKYLGGVLNEKLEEMKNE